MTLDQEINHLLESCNHFNDKELFKLRESIEFAQKAHGDQIRFSGEPYIIHPIKIAQYLAKKKFDLITIQAALLHDTFEDCGISIIEIIKRFGKNVAQIVSGVSKLGEIRFRKNWFSNEEIVIKLTNFEKQSETIKKMILAMSKDIRVIIIKLIDRTHNMETLEFVPKEKQYRIAKETMDVFAPIADRLGMGEIKNILQNLAFPYLFKDEYQHFIKKYNQATKNKENYCLKVNKILLKKLVKNSIIAKVEKRVKSAYSTFGKMKSHDNQFEKITDLVALRIIVDSESIAYQVLGLVHKLYRPIPNLIKDYISQPKPNGYQSLHTTIFGPNSQVLEIQIRTKEMDKQAKYGIASHWLYKEYSKQEFDNRKFAKSMPWIKEIAKWSSKIKDIDEFSLSMKTDFFTDRIFIYTPKGDIKDLPIESTPIDFAFSIHSEVGYSMSGAKINGKIKQISSLLNNSDIVEILTSKRSAGPKREWLKFAKTYNARYHIKKYLKRFQ